MTSKKKNIKKTTDTSNSITNTTITETETIHKIELHKLVNPCNDIEMYTKVILYPHQMNNDIYINLKKNLVDKLENKCTQHGFIKKIHKITSYTNGIIEPENFTGSAVYNVKYLANICIPIEKTIIIGKITSIIPNTQFVVVEYGNILKLIFMKRSSDINTQKFSIIENNNIKHTQSGKILSNNDYIKVVIKAVKFYPNDTMIKCMVSLEDIPTNEEIQIYGFVDTMISEIEQKDKDYNIEFNEDIEQVEENIEKSNIMMDV
jgi:DNA-directed RNA polymerase subunit E'/Rpb7